LRAYTFPETFDATIVRKTFWGTLKSELACRRRFAGRQQAQREITEYIEILYNRRRTQAQLDYPSPAVFTQRFYLNRIAAKPVGVQGFPPTSLTLVP
jgi:hypothetical protein